MNRLQEVCQQEPNLPSFARIIHVVRQPWDVEKDEIGRTIMYVPSNKIKPAKCQRPQDIGFINKIDENFIAALYRNPVGYYERGHVHIVDCQHSTGAAKKRTGLIPVVLVSKQCATDFFILLNSEIRKVTLNDKFNADLINKNSLALYMVDYLEGNGVTFGLRGRKADDKYTVVPGSIYKRLQKYGIETWTSIMGALLDCWDGEATSMEDTFQNGFFSFYLQKMENRNRPKWSKIKRKTAFYVQRRGAAINAELKANSGGLKDGIRLALKELEEA